MVAVVWCPRSREIIRPPKAFGRVGLSADPSSLDTGVSGCRRRYTGAAHLFDAGGILLHVQ
eukprot:7918013-Prorocentrum_lima.AAC.1